MYVVTLAAQDAAGVVCWEECVEAWCPELGCWVEADPALCADEPPEAYPEASYVGA